MYFARKLCMLFLAFTLLADPARSAAMSSVPAGSRANRYAILVNKAKRELIVFFDDKPIRTFHIAALGKDPVGHKTRRGDNKTPEGDYYLVYKNEKSICDRSLELSYPNANDARRALEHHLITADEYSQIIVASENHAIPPQDTLLGGDIFIHGADHCMMHPEATHGCIALHNADMRELFDLVPVGTAITIRP